MAVNGSQNHIVIGSAATVRPSLFLLPLPCSVQLMAKRPPPPLPMALQRKVSLRPRLTAYHITGEFHYDYVRRLPAGVIRDYICEAYPRGHAYCKCMLHKKFRLFISHNNNEGRFPIHDLRMHELIDEYLQDNKLEQHEYTKHSYGWLFGEQLNVATWRCI